MPPGDVVGVPGEPNINDGVRQNVKEPSKRRRQDDDLLAAVTLQRRECRKMHGGSVLATPDDV